VDDYLSQIDKPPFVVRVSAGTAEYRYVILAAVFFYMFLQSVHMRLAGNGGNDKKIRPVVNAAKIQHTDILSIMFF